MVKHKSKTAIFSRDEATLYERVSVRRLVGPSVLPSVTLLLFGLLGATYAVYTALLWSNSAFSFDYLINEKTAEDVVEMMNRQISAGIPPDSELQAAWPAVGWSGHGRQIPGDESG